MVAHPPMVSGSYRLPVLPVGTAGLEGKGSFVSWIFAFQNIGNIFLLETTESAMMCSKGGLRAFSPFLLHWDFLAQCIGFI